MDLEEKTALGTLGAGCVVLLINLAIWGGIAYVAGHFIRRYW